MDNNSKITFKFNLLLFIFFCVDQLVALLFDPKSNEKVPWDVVYDSFPVLSIILSFLIGILLLLWCAKMAEYFWNKFVSDIFKVRPIFYQEALSIILIFSIIAL